MSSQIKYDSIFVFSVLDKLMQMHKKDKEVFLKLYEQKKVLIGLLQSEKINDDRYKKLVKKAAKSDDQLMKQCALADLQKLQDPKNQSMLFQWFKEMVDATGLEMDEQQKIAQEHSKEIAKTNPNSIQSIKETMKKSSIRNTNKDVLRQEDINEKQVVSLKAADKVLKKCEHLPQLYQKVLDQKMRLLSLINKQQIKANSYKNVLEQYLTKIKNEDVLADTKLELEELNYINNGNLQVWFADLVEESKESLNQQKKTLMRINPAIKSTFFESHIKQVQMPVNAPPLPNKGGAKKEEIKNQEKEVPQKVPQIQQKSKLQQKGASKKVQQASNSKLQEPNHKAKQTSASKVKEASNSKVPQQKKQVKQSKVQEAPVHHSQAEEKKATQIKKQEGNDKEKLNIKTEIQSRVRLQLKDKQKQEKVPDLKEVEEVHIQNIVSFAVLQDLLEKEIDNQNKCEEIAKRKKHMLEQHKKGVLTAEKYKENIENMMKTCNNQDVKACIKVELDMLTDLHEGNVQHWFNDLLEQEQEVEVESLLKNQNELKLSISNLNGGKEQKQVEEKPQKTLSVVKDRKNLSATEQLFAKKYKDQSSKRKDEFLRLMAHYESWLYLYKKNGVPFENNKRLLEYLKTKQNIEENLKEIQKDITIDVHWLAGKMFPTITEQIFYDNQLEKYKTKDIKMMISSLEKESEELKKYIGGIKKGTNSKNLETSKKEMNEIGQNITFLKKWPNGKFQPLPYISSEIIKKYNMDSNELEQNQVQIEILNIQGVTGNFILRIFIENKNPIFEGEITNAMKVKQKAKCSEQAMNDIMKGKGEHIVVIVFEKGFFGGLTKVEEKKFSESFNRVNTREWKVQVRGITLQCLVKVNMAAQPLVTEIEHFILKILPAYEHSKFVQEQLVKKYLIYQCPTPSEILK